MQIFSTINDIQDYVNNQKKLNHIIGFVPTMGALHEGHLSLIKKAQTHSHKTIVSIFINPKQFGENEDFSIYPRELTKDKNKLIALGVDALFLPSESVMYDDVNTTIDVGYLAKILCGKSRPHFFNGVAIAVTKLFNIIKPDIAVFGEKDYQQLLVIKQLVRDLNINIKILSGKIFRQPDGLAMSSRNVYLNEEQRTIAPKFYEILSSINIDDDINQAKKHLNQYFTVDYLALLDADNLKKNSATTSKYIVLSAVTLGNVRLIDNIIKISHDK